MIAAPNGKSGRKPADFSESPTSDRSSATNTAPESVSPDAPANPLEPLLQQLAILREFALHYLEVQKDSVRAKVYRTMFYSVLGVIAALVAATLIVACTVKLVQGLSEAVTVVASGRVWIGDLSIGGGLLLVIALGAWVFVKRQLRTARQRTIRKYESRHYAQRQKFGADITQRAAE
jgi:hypothetical protein